jgi:hypothetical protein
MEAFVKLKALLSFVLVQKVIQAHVVKCQQLTHAYHIHVKMAVLALL